MAVHFFAAKAKMGEFRVNAKAKLQSLDGLIGKTELTLVLPDTFMNKSGLAVARYVKSVKAADHLIVCYDDLDLPLGTIKLSYDRGSGGHKGLESIIAAVKTKKFVRVRIGVSPVNAKGLARKPQGEEKVSAFILAKFKPAELEELKKVFKRIAQAIETTVLEGRERAMNEFNS